MRIGLISDTHLPSLVHSLDELGPSAGEALRDVDLILHGGDVIAPAVLDWCEQFADVLVAKGNNDIFTDPRLASTQFVDSDGFRIGMAHELRPESRPMDDIVTASLGGESVDVVVGGDTHVERLEFREGILLVNSGSPILPHHLSTRLGSLAMLETEPGQVRAEIVDLGSTRGLRNPVRSQHVVIKRGDVIEASLGGRALSAEEFSLVPNERLRLVPPNISG
ncbi:MAG TPA: metallophosphoesterase family protein [Dehalococcoidia bacterium]|nr:metallophosphoesterase family protein [Dehalococcoidia bacterium]